MNTEKGLNRDSAINQSIKSKLSMHPVINISMHMSISKTNYTSHYVYNDLNGNASEAHMFY